MDENKIYNDLNKQYGAVTSKGETADATGAATGTATAAATGTDTGATQPLGSVNVTVSPEREQAIRDMYNANLEAQRINLQESGAQALSDAQANRDKIAQNYNAQRNASAVDWERQRRNFLEGANTSGINTGANSQAQLSMMGQQQKSQNTLNAAQANAETEADRNIADISRQTQASINEAIAKNDYQLAAALLDEYKNEYNRQMDRAAALGQYGDFSGYAAIYGDTAAQQMFYSWAAQNPQLAYMMGAITEDQYNNLISGSPINGGAALAGGGGGGNGGFAPNYGLLAAQHAMNQQLAALDQPLIQTDGYIGPETSGAYNFLHPNG